MLKTILHYGHATPSTGWFHTPGILDTQSLASSAHIRPSTWPNADYGYAIEMPVRKAPNERVSSILVVPRCTSSRWFARGVLFGCTNDPTRAENWVGPVDRQETSSTLWGVMKRRMRPPGAGVLSAKSTWYIGQAMQFDTQDFEHVGVLPQIASTGSSFAHHSGLIFDVYVQESVA